MHDCRIVVNSCPRREPIQQIWKKCFAENWPDCPYPVIIISEREDLGWNANLIRCLETLTEEFILLMLDDNFIEPLQPLTQNMESVLITMEAIPDIGMIKLQAGGAHAPEIEFTPWSRIREYDRQPHPFKRTNLVPCMYRRNWLLRLATIVLQTVKDENGSDQGRQGAIEFEVTGTKLTMDATAWPERMLGIHRPGPKGSGGDSLLMCTANDAVTGGSVRNIPVLRKMCVGVQGIEAFL